MDNYFQARGVQASMYENFRLPMYFKEVLEGIDEGARILDFGCGFGQTLCAIKTAAKENAGGGNINVPKSPYLCGIDINKHAIESVRQAGIECLYVENILDFIPQEKFDLIIATHTLEHLPKDSIIPTLVHFREHVLKENGRIFVAVPNAQSHTGCYWAYEDFTHNTLFTTGSLKYVLAMAGFSDTKIIDKDALANTKGLKKIIRKALLQLYYARTKLYNRITNSAFHAPSEISFSYEIKALGINKSKRSNNDNP